MTDDAIHHVSDTALWVASYRALESERTDAAFKDPLAARLAGERGRAIAAAMPGAALTAWVMVVRTVAIDRLLMRCIERGVDTVINLGAGLDTRPYRMELPATLRWVEIDFPGMIDHKNTLLHDEKPNCRLERLSVDLRDGPSRREALSSIGDAARSCCVLTEGLLPYLATDDVSALAADLLAIPSMRFWVHDFYDGNVGDGPRRAWRERLAAAPIVFEPGDWFGFFRERGWRLDERVLSFEEGRRLKRRPPFSRLALTMLLSTPPTQWRALRERAGYALLERSSFTAGRGTPSSPSP